MMKQRIAAVLLFLWTFAAFIIVAIILLHRGATNEELPCVLIDESIESVEESGPEVVKILPTYEEIRLNRQKQRERQHTFIYESLLMEVEVKVPSMSEAPDLVRYSLGYTEDDCWYYDGYYKYDKWHKMPMNDYYQHMVFQYCEIYEVPYELALAVSGIETSFDAERGLVVGRNGQGYFGPGMVNKAYYEKRTGLTLSTPEDGVMAMVDTLGRKLREFDNNFHFALMAYNYGSGYTRGKINEGQTSSKYSNRVIEIYNGLLRYKNEIEVKEVEE